MLLNELLYISLHKTTFCLNDPGSLRSWSVYTSALSSSLSLCHRQILLATILYSFPELSFEMLNALDPNADACRAPQEAPQYHVIWLLVLSGSLVVYFPAHCGHILWKLYSVDFLKHGLNYCVKHINW